MAFDFPNTPAVGDLFQDSSSGAVYRWNGYAWVGGVTGPSLYLPLSGGVMTGPITPAAVPGIVGVTDGSNAAPGSVGEVISSVTSSAVGIAINTTVNLTSIVLGAGDWDVCGEVLIIMGTTAGTGAHGGITTTSATIPGSTSLATSRATINTNLTASAGQMMALRPCRLNLMTPTTVYLVVQAVVSAGAPTAYGSIIARRVR